MQTTVKGIRTIIIVYGHSGKSTRGCACIAIPKVNAFVRTYANFSPFIRVHSLVFVYSRSGYTGSLVILTVRAKFKTKVRPEYT